MTGLELVNVIKKFPGFTLGPINLKVEPEVRVVIGPTGSGKTTILNLISGLLRPDMGSILLNDVNITNQPLEIRKIGYLFQKPFLFPHLRVYDNIIFGKRKDESIGDSEIMALLKDLGIWRLCDRKIEGLSGGEMQKISLARMLVTKPKVILMDEPLSNLDELSKRNLRRELRMVLKERNIPTIYVTHFEHDAYALADTISILYDGRLVYSDTLDGCLKVQKPSSVPYYFDFFGAEGNFIEGIVMQSGSGIAKFRYGAQTIEILGEYPVGSKVGILIRPEDIILSKQALKTSARNVLLVKIVDIKKPAESIGTIKVYMMLEKRLCLVAKITEEARLEIGIRIGDELFIIFKASAPTIVREEFLN
ncbi:MAG TPA: ABC transporter ATP-binding protein [Nitrososphaeraceae archaeon]|jgi:molybdopterin-binding protein